MCHNKAQKRYVYSQVNITRKKECNMISGANTKSVTVEPVTITCYNTVSYFSPYAHESRHDALIALENIRKHLPPRPSGMQDYPSVDPVYDGTGNVVGFRPFVVRKPDLHLAYL